MKTLTLREADREEILAEVDRRRKEHKKRYVIKEIVIPSIFTKKSGVGEELEPIIPHLSRDDIDDLLDKCEQVYKKKSGKHDDAVNLLGMLWESEQADHDRIKEIYGRYLSGPARYTGRSYGKRIRFIVNVPEHADMIDTQAIKNYYDNLEGISSERAKLMSILFKRGVIDPEEVYKELDDGVLNRFCYRSDIESIILGLARSKKIDIDTLFSKINVLELLSPKNLNSLVCILSEREDVNIDLITRWYDQLLDEDRPLMDRDVAESIATTAKIPGIDPKIVISYIDKLSRSSRIGDLAKSIPGLAESGILTPDYILGLVEKICGLPTEEEIKRITSEEIFLMDSSSIYELEDAKKRAIDSIRFRRNEAISHLGKIANMPGADLDKIVEVFNRGIEDKHNSTVFATCSTLPELIESGAIDLDSAFSYLDILTDKEKFFARSNRIQKDEDFTKHMMGVAKTIDILAERPDVGLERIYPYYDILLRCFDCTMGNRFESDYIEDKVSHAGIIAQRLQKTGIDPIKFFAVFINDLADSKRSKKMTVKEMVEKARSEENIGTDEYHLSKYGLLDPDKIHKSLIPYDRKIWHMEQKLKKRGGKVCHSTIRAYLDLLAVDETIEDEQREFIYAYLKAYNRLDETNTDKEGIIKQLMEKVVEKEDIDYERLTTLLESCDSLEEMMQSQEVYSPKFRIIKKVGEGGGRRAFLVHDRVMETVSVMKIIMRDEGQDCPGSPTRDKTPETAAKREIKTLMGLEHPNVTRYFEWGRIETGPMAGRYFLIEQYVSGRNLEKRLPEINKKQALEALLKAIDGVSYVHGRDIIFRDLKLDNILTSEDLEEVRLTDFEHAVELTGDRTNPGPTLGSPRYRSPEQIAGKPATVASDIYALAGCVYSVLTQNLRDDGKVSGLEDINGLPKEEYEQELRKKLEDIPLLVRLKEMYDPKEHDSNKMFDLFEYLRWDPSKRVALNGLKIFVNGLIRDYQD